MLSLQYSCNDVLMYSLDAMPGYTDLILVIAKSCPVESTAKECLSYQQLQEPRESLSYKRLTSGGPVKNCLMRSPP